MARRKKVSVKVKKQQPIKTTKQDNDKQLREQFGTGLKAEQSQRQRKPRKPTPKRIKTLSTSWHKSKPKKQPRDITQERINRGIPEDIAQLRGKAYTSAYNSWKRDQKFDPNAPHNRYDIGKFSRDRAIQNRLTLGYPIEIATLWADEYRRWKQEWDTESNFTREQIIQILSANTPLKGETDAQYKERKQRLKEYKNNLDESELSGTELPQKQGTAPSEDVLSESDTAELMFRQIMSNIETASLYLGGKYSHEGIDAIRFFVQGGYYEFGAPFIKQLTALPEFANLATAKEIYDSSKSPGYAFALVETLSSKMNVFDSTSLEPFGVLYDEEFEE